MSEAIKPTPGPWTVDKAPPNALYRYVECGEGDSFGYVCRISTNGNANSQDDALLIADAGNTFAATGLTPRQLVERVKELEEVARSLVAYDEAEHEDHVLLMLDYADMLKAARAALSKDLPNAAAKEAGK